MEDDVFDITNGEVSDARRVDRRRDLWKITIEPDGDDDVVVTLPATTDCSATGAVCSETSQGKPSQPLSRSVTATVAGPQPDPITAAFSGMPEEHNGSEFTFDLAFSENVKAGFRRIRDKAFTLSGNSKVTKAKRKTQGSNQNWTITVDPKGNNDVTITLPETTDCDDDGAICTDEGGLLNHSTTDTVLGPVGISIGDAEVEEGANAVLVFAVALSRATSSQMTIDYATSDGTATAGADYTATSGTLTIDAGSSSGSIEVGVIDDEHNEGSETFTLTLSNASSGDLTDASATGTITNHDALLKALIARFGRTAAVHIVEQVEERVNAPRRPGFDGRVAGRQINRDMGQQFALDFLQQLGGGGHGQRQGQRGGQVTAAAANDPRFGNGGMTSSLGPQNGRGRPMNAGGMQGLQPRHAYDGGAGMNLGGDRLLGGSSFALNRATSSGGVLSFWSRSAQSSFYGQDGALALNGDVRSTMFGADYAKGRMITGVSLAHSRGLGSYAGVDSGQMTSAVTGLYPWIGYKASERVTVWTVAGYGAGGLMLRPGAGAPIETGLSMAMAAGGGRGQILGGGQGLRPRLQGGRPVGRHASEGGKRSRRQPGLDEGRGQPHANRHRRLAEHDGRETHGADAQRRDRDSPGRGRRGDGARHGPGGRPRTRGRRDGARGRHPRAQAPGPPGRGVCRERHVDLGQLQPDALYPARLHRTRLARLGRRRDGRCRGIVGPGEHGRHEPRPADERRGPTARHRSGLRTADRQPFRGHTAGGSAHVRARPGLPDRLRHAGARTGTAEPAARRGRRTAGESDLPPARAERRHRPARARARNRAVVGGAPAPTTNPTRTGRRQTTGARSNDNRNALQQEAPGVADPETRRASK